MEDWEFEQLMERVYFRMRNTVSFADLKIGDDDKQVQNHQIELYQGEVRNGVNRIQEFGISTMPLPGSKAMVMHHGGQRSIGSVIATEDPRYRLTGLKPGEQQGYMVDGAQKDGTGGTARSLWKGLLGWVHQLFGKTINIGTQADTTSITMDANGTITITANTIILAGTVKLGSASASIPVSKQGTVDSRGDTDTSNFAPNVYVS